MAGVWDIGDSVPLVVAFTNEAGAAADPTDVLLDVLDPTGFSRTYAYSGLDITRTGTGAYSRSVTPDLSGVWQWRWRGTGAVTAVDEGSFRVQGTAFA
jgi:hypothetical protein